MADESWDIPLPPFNPTTALLNFKRFLRDQHALTERGSDWLLGGHVVIQLSVEDETFRAQLAKRPARSPEWDRFVMRSAPDVRKLLDEVKRRLLHWRDPAG